ncbi:hypothetical protein SBOR_5775 [Sclerotinia borealis F-4128]|uniref:Uncharacterized protein n=1 Tax=Sclerotinia borealis (strain F-4128) TaxID=1432307 RepID=W9CGH7_SCLBF|nr:hypothetical protein SBOR_5775 [Sclerotinia borealis F-4128]
MASRIKNWILKRSSSTNDSHKLEGKPYEKAESSDTPSTVTPAGTNLGDKLSFDDVARFFKTPKVEYTGSNEETNIWAGRTYTTLYESAEAPITPITPGRRQNTAKSNEHDGRPRTAPSDEDGRGGGRRSSLRTFSEFATRSSPFLRHKKSTASQHILSRTPEATALVFPSPPTSAHHISPPTSPYAYESIESARPMATPSYVPHHRRDSSRSSKASRNSYVDILDVHDNMKGGRDTYRNCTIAAEARIYGDDIANGNLAMENARLDHRDHKFSYLKSIYYGVAETEGSKRSRLGLLERIPRNDDTETLSSSSYTQSVSRSLVSLSESRQEIGLDLPEYTYGYSAGSCQNQDSLTTGSDSNFDHHQRDLETAQTTTYTASIREARRRAFVFTQLHPIQLASHRRESEAINSSNTTSTMRDTLRTVPANDRRPFHSASTVTSMRQNPDLSSSIGTSGNALDRTPRTMPSPSHYSTISTNDRTETTVDDDDMHVNGTKFPIANGQKHTSSPTTDQFEKGSYLVEERAEPISLEGVVDLTNTVDTTVHKRVAPAVIQEHVLPTEHEIITREIFREVHQHHYYHRALPVIDTEILPAKHYVYGDDGDTLMRIPESMVPGHTITGSRSQNWSIVLHQQPAPAEDAFDSPLFGVEPDLPDTKYTTHYQPNSNGQLEWSRVPGEPVKVMEREYMTAEGFPRKETWWRYPPVLATAAYEAGLTVPMHWNHVPAGKEQTVTEEPASTPQKEKKIKELRDLEHAQAAEYNNVDHLDSNMGKLREQKLYGGLSNSDSVHARELNDMHSSSLSRETIAQQQTTNRPSTQDSGYSGLDGASSPVAKGPSHLRNSSGSSISSLLGKVRGDDGRKSMPVGGEATKYLQRLREKRRSSTSSTGTGPRAWGRRSEDVGRRSEGIRSELPLTDDTKKVEHLFGVATPMV